MALVKFGGGVVQMAGSIGGNTFARNKGGNYVRARTKPINPNSPRQGTVRSTLTALTVTWAQVLTAADRTAWNLYAASVIMTNRLGESINLSGFNHYVRSNSNLLRDGKATIAAGPTVFELPEADPTFAFTISEATQLITVTFDDTLAWAAADNNYLFVFCSQPQNAQRNFFDGPWRLADTIDGDTAAPITSPQDVAPPFRLTQGQKVWCYARIARADGRLSNTFRADVLVSA